MSTSNALSQLARMYQRIELILRDGTLQNNGITVSELNKTQAINDIKKSDHQVRDILLTLVKKGFVNKVRATAYSREVFYKWNESAPPFVFGMVMARKANTKPSIVTNTKPDSAVIQQVAKIAQEIELQIGGVTVIVGRNPTTGRLRIIVEEV